MNQLLSNSAIYFITLNGENFFFEIKENISVNHIAHILMRLRIHLFLKFKEKKNNQEIFLKQRNFSLIVLQCTNLFDLRACDTQEISKFN